MKNVVDSRPSQALSGTLFNEFAFNHISIRVGEPVDQIQYNRAFISLDMITIHRSEEHTSELQVTL